MSSGEGSRRDGDDGPEGEEHARPHAHPHPHPHPHSHSHSHDAPHDHHPHPHPHAHDAHAHAHAHPHAHAHSQDPHHSHDPPPAHPHSHDPHHGPVAAEGHAGSHEHVEAPRNERLEEGAGRGKILFFDCFSGVAGDMTIAALLDLGVPLLVVERAVAQLPLEGFHLHRGHAHRSGIVATSFDVHVEAAQPHRTYGGIDAMLASSTLDEPTKALSRRIFRRLGEAEAAVHQMPIEDVHFHEVGAVDAIVDVVGASAALCYVGADVVGSPLPMGRGFVRAAHGVLPLPAPATVLCLKGYPTYGVELEFELVTPTGAAILATVASRSARWPTIAPSRVGFGAGQRDLPDRPNLLRLVLGDPPAVDEASTGSHVLLEANVDDLTGEVAGHALEALLAAGALDAWAAPITMKKGRPAWTLSALASVAQADNVAASLLRETSSIGVRRTLVSRTERPRRTIVVDTPFGEIRVKVSEGPFGPPQVKPEFDDCAAAARAHGVPVREVIAQALEAARLAPR